MVLVVVVEPKVLVTVLVVLVDLDFVLLDMSEMLPQDLQKQQVVRLLLLELRQFIHLLHQEHFRLLMLD